MAFAALMSLCHVTDQILGLEDFDLRYFPFPMEAVESFQETIFSLLTFLDDCPPICTQRINELITEIRDASYEVEDILESLMATHFRRKYGGDGNGRLKRVPEIGFEQIVGKLESINMEVGKIKLDGSDVHELRVSALAGSFRSTSLRDDTKKVALDKDLEMELMERLVEGCSKIDVIPIVGMGGIGKTTLAKILYDSQLMKETFHVRGWSVVSQIYDIHEIATNILKRMRVPLDGKKEVEQHLYQSLFGRKYLIVLDDVWDTQVWDDIKRLFPDNKNGSRIILTTRDLCVASYADSFSSTCCEMQLLNEDSSWSLLCQEIFLQKNCPPELVEIGKEIASQCQGLPLAISAIGGHLKKEKQAEEYWKYVSENISSVLKTTNDPSLEILTLSYNYLPHYLKACFLYFGSFQEDCAMSVCTIVKLWVAEGFLSPWSDNMEEDAEEYLYELIDRNLVIVNYTDSFGRPKSVRIHSLFRDICIREAEKEKFLCILNMRIPLDLMKIYSQRRLVFVPNIEEDDGSVCSSIFPRDDSFSAIRSFICHGDQNFSSTIELSLGLLKVLQVSLKSVKFPVEILELVNLKYLQLGVVWEIPSSISRLGNLQTIIAESQDCDQSLPSEIWEMPQLRHLFVSNFHMPDIRDDVQSKDTNSYVLENLQTLVGIVDFSCTQEVATRIPNLKELKCEIMSCPSSNSLVNLCKLESLSLVCNFEDDPKDNIFPNFFFPSSLKRLVLCNCQIPWEQLTTLGTLPNLEVLKLKCSMVGNLWETNEGEFKQLKFLVIEDSDLVEWKTEKDHFPILECLELGFCKALGAIPSEIGEIPTLEIIFLYKCSLAAESSAKKMFGEASDIELVIQ